MNRIGTQALDIKILGRRIREAREQQGLSQEQFADLVGKDQTAISAYETGNRRVAAVDIAVFAEALQIPVSVFFKGEYDPSELDTLLLQHFHKIPDQSREKAINVIRLMASAIKENSSE